jgi:hypothetical protein
MTRSRRRRGFSLCLALLLVLSAGATGASAESAGRSSLASGGGALDRVAYAVDAAESSHGADPRMWRLDLDGPQGPMQVSAAAATDAGSGDRFDETENRALGRAYLQRMFRRYGSWPDAVAAYNWGPARLDDWIGGGRLIEKLPPTVARYRTRVMVASGLAIGSVGDAFFGSIADRLARLRMLARRQMAERHRLGHRADVVELLYSEIMRSTQLTAE